MRENGSTSNEEAIMSLEQDIREILPYIGSSADRFLAIMRSVVQECWRQAAFVYLYMAVCGDPCDTPRVKKAFKRFMNLLNGTKPGRLPDDFLSLPLALVSPVAQRQRDREAIRLRVLEFHRRGQAIRANNHITRLVEDYWARADTERRPITWSDVAVSQRRVLGV
ncbi:unnamed protein product [Rhizoctonia solani]|uniref:Uncharacterized protein n=1 Tax=Rhizoctonia solani TaxID=456999 RepID=A0A8H3DGE4_9AGAM|nr:unnamed protein product [Rhizoctonia solani]